jgi:uncharacterized protein YdaU (DUF1376 family)
MKNPQFPFFVRDWICSRRVLQMSGDAVKAYVYLLCEAWLQIPRATIPQDENEIASMARVSMDQWKCIKNDIMNHWLPGKCTEHKGRFYNELLLEISRKHEAKQRFNNENAKRSQTDTEKPISDNDTDIDTSSLKSSSLVLSSFEDFWKTYPKKIAKARAIKAWSKIKEPVKTLELIKIALSWQIKTDQWVKNHGQFIPLPATYLNDNRWIDEPPREFKSTSAPSHDDIQAALKRDRELL